MPRRVTPVYVWVPPDRSQTDWSVTINGTDVTDYILSGKFTRGLIGEDCNCEIELDNSGENYTTSFQIGQEIIFYMDFSGGTTSQWKGTINEIKKQINDTGFILKINGSHYTAGLVDVTVTEEYTNSTITDIWKDLVDTYLTAHTYTNVETITTDVNVKWNNKPLLDCFVDLMNLGDCDAFLDNDKDFHLFTKNSKLNDSNEAGVIIDDALNELYGLGEDSVDVRNKVVVYGESGGLPVIYTTQDSTSQSTYGVKEKIVTDSSIVDEDQAEAFSDAENTNLKDPPTKGSASCFLFLPGLIPGYKSWVICPPQQVHDRYRPVKFTFSIPDCTTEVFYTQERGIAKLFKERIQKDLGQETITNPFKMLYSYNFTFNDYTKTDENASNNITISEGNLQITSGVTGTWISQPKTTSITATKCQVMISGEAIDVTPYVSFDGTDNYQSLSFDRTMNEILSTNEITITNQGTIVRLKLVINSASTIIGSVGLYWK